MQRKNMVSEENEFPGYIHSWVECLPEIVIAERIFVNRAFESQFEANVIKLFMKFVMELNI